MALFAHIYPRSLKKNNDLPPYMMKVKTFLS